MSKRGAVCVYCGSSSQVSEAHKRTARETGALIAGLGLDLIYGGGRVGLMGLVADSALEAGGRVVGIIPDHIRAMEVDHGGLSELHVVDGMHARKAMMIDRSDAFVMLPGGLGTLDETFEILTWRQLGIHDKPIFVLNTNDYWRPFLDLIDHLEAEGFYRPAGRRLYEVVSRVEDLAEVLPVTGDTNKTVETRWL